MLLPRYASRGEVLRLLLHMVIAYQLPCSFITDPTQHLTKFL